MIFAAFFTSDNCGRSLFFLGAVNMRHSPAIVHDKHRRRRAREEFHLFFDILKLKFLRQKLILRASCPLQYFWQHPITLKPNTFGVPCFAYWNNTTASDWYFFWYDIIIALNENGNQSRKKIYGSGWLDKTRHLRNLGESFLVKLLTGLVIIIVENTQLFFSSITFTKHNFYQQKNKNCGYRITKQQKPNEDQKAESTTHVWIHWEEKKQMYK